jgi:DnaJ-class molecular chaperone
VTPNFYQVLGVAYDDPREKIRARYRLLALKTHPDTAGPHHKDVLTVYAQAYRVLGHQARRERYNADLGIFIKARSLHPGHHLYQRVMILPELARQGGVALLNFVRYQPCSLCWLMGCHRCNQQGMVPEQVCIEVKVPPNTQNNSSIFIEGQGGQSEPGGSRGDLFVYVTIG